MNDYQAVLNVAGSVFIVWAALVGVASVVVHLRVFDRRSVMSMHLLGYMSAMAAVLVLSCIRIFTGDSWWFQLLRLVVFMAVPIMMTHRLWLQVHAQRAPWPPSDQDKAPIRDDEPA